MILPTETEPSRPRMVKLRDRIIHVADDQPTFWDRVEAGLWEPGTLAVIDRWIDRKTLFVDLGAWVGPTALFAASLGARVVAVEADPAALDQLARNLAVNPRLSRLIEVVPRAIHATGGQVRLGARRKQGDSMSSVLLAASATTWSADAVTPAELAGVVGKAEKLFVKIDIEGGEFDLLPAMLPLVAPPACAVLVSFHPKLLASIVPDRAMQVLATQRALDVFAGWTAFGITRDGAVALEPNAAAIAARTATDQWLFLKPAG